MVEAEVIENKDEIKDLEEKIAEEEARESDM